MLVAEQVEYLQQGLVRQALGIAAVAHEQTEQGVQRGFVLLPGELLDGQLVAGLVVAGIARQAALQLGGVRQRGGLTQEGQLGAGTGQRGLVRVALDRVEDQLGFAQLTAFGQAAGIQDQGRGMAVVFRQQRLEQGFRLADAAFGEQRLGCLEGVGLFGGRFGYVRLEQFTNRRFGLCAGEAVDRLAILEQHHGGQAADAEAHHDVLLDVTVDLGQQQLAAVLLGDLRQQRHQRLAGRAPLGPEVHQHRLVEGVLDHQLLEAGGTGDVEDVGGIAHGMQVRGRKRRIASGFAARAASASWLSRTPLSRGWRGTG